ncbi:MAG: sugar kinase [Bacillota bacterium]|uniref:sugar kinase n=1 Tax=Cytobacillus firmus TaxID=1399 RepID=UPI00064EAA6E|nr:sugar kinase [Cytobacillus firmus]KML41930.1 2-keto-3-deoxygluconate kinase [Cytobacillus firmus]MBG9446806.1 2-keto-3-deoxygluconate kinase [Cytobacillus firmus]MBG9448047.1 2-keto-3-deoxygluconate kinase [Cytobacillus firmus]MBY6052987.1 sugar kinase [Cytobacillus firmus]
MKDVVTIGDAMITFNPSATGPMRFVPTFERKIGGAELNVAIGCSRLGLKTGWISRLGNDEFGRHIFNTVRGEGIDVSQLKLVDGYPTSLNFKEIMGDGSVRTFYYRTNSPTTALTIETLSEEYIKNSKVLHITGIFPAVDKEKNIDLIKYAISLAKKHGVLVSFDPNIRLKLWTKEEARTVLREFLPYVDIFLTGEEEAELLLGTSDPREVIELGKAFGISHIAIKQGEKGSVGYQNGEYIEAPAFKAKKVVDTVGAGDGFDSGFIYGLLNQWPLQKTLQFANVIGSMVVSVSGDNEGLPYLEDVLVQLGEREFVER